MVYSKKTYSLGIMILTLLYPISEMIVQKITGSTDQIDRLFPTALLERLSISRHIEQEEPP